ncbi:heavy metal-associated isoprenylated plant protein 5-like [Curcuma longa]|uniref:heavy metal-associated isoprenylated plant protein 5-like n=1 Tax=Curcuma longa TaxID=136217 RepID=UPI003D9E9FB3
MAEEGKKEGSKKDAGGESGSDRGKKEEEFKNPPTPPPPSPPLPPQEEVVMRVYMDCAGCARKVRQSLQGFPGVEEVVADSRTHLVVVKGRKAAEDPLKMVARVQKKSGKKVELLSPLPTLPTPPEKKVEDQKPIGENKPQVIVAVLRVYMHCEACAQEIKKRILRMKGVRSAEPNLTASEVTVKGVFHPEILAAYVLKRTGKHATVVKQEPEEKPAEDTGESKAEETPPPAPAADGDASKDEKKPEGSEQVNKEDEEGEKKKPEEGGSRNEGDQRDKKADGDADTKEEQKKTDAKKEGKKAEEVVVVVDNMGAAGTPMPPPSVDGDGDGAGGSRKILIKENYYYYYPKYPVEFFAYPPQIFSDENPNACVVM